MSAPEPVWHPVGELADFEPDKPEAVDVDTDRDHVGCQDDICRVHPAACLFEDLKLTRDL